MYGFPTVASICRPVSRFFSATRMWMSRLNSNLSIQSEFAVFTIRSHRIFHKNGIGTIPPKFISYFPNLTDLYVDGGCFALCFCSVLYMSSGPNRNDFSKNGNDLYVDGGCFTFVLFGSCMWRKVPLSLLAKSE